jgi:hypothetical protein
MIILIRKFAFFVLLMFQFHSINASAQVWPFGKALDFPWDNIPGIWYGENEQESVTFSFDVGVDGDGVHREVLVNQISGRSHRILASGTIVVGSNNIGSGLMITNDFLYCYNITVRLVQKKNAMGPNDKKYTVVTVEPLLGDLSGGIFHFEMVKTSNHPLRRDCGFFQQDEYCSFDKRKSKD